MSPILELHQVSIGYDEVANPILSEANLTLEDGETVLVLGPSGGGKSTLLLALAGLIPRVIPGKVTGTVRISGVDASDKRLAEFSSIVATVLQDPESQLTSLNVEDEVAFALENFNLPATEIRETVENIMQKAGLWEIKDRLVYTLSGGQMQRLAIACALARKPRLLVLDEPLSNLDPVGVLDVMELVREVVSYQTSSLVMAAHDFASFADLFTRVIIVADGRIVRDGPIRTVLAEVPFLKNLGLEIPYYVQIAYQHLGDELTEAPLSLDEMLTMIRHKGITLSPHGVTRTSGKPKDENAIVLDNVSVRFGRSAPIVRDVSCAIKQGEIVALLGFNGSGKSTLALTIAGAIPPFKGKMTIMGEPLDARNHRRAKKTINRHVGYVFQYPEHQFLHSTLSQEVTHGLSPEDFQNALDELKEIGLVDPERHPYELSGGQKRRLSVKSAVVHRPTILILDEPTYGQDARYREVIEDDLKKLHQAGTTVLMITHDMDLVDRLASRILVLQRGELVYDGDTDTLFLQAEEIKKLGLTLPSRYSLRCENNTKPILRSFLKEA